MNLWRKYFKGLNSVLLVLLCYNPAKPCTQTLEICDTAYKGRLACDQMPDTYTLTIGKAIHPIRLNP